MDMILCRQGQKKECIVLKKRRKKYDIKNGKKNPCNRIDSYDVCDNYLYWGLTVNAADFEEVQITEISAGVKIDTEIKKDNDMVLYHFVPQETGKYHFHSIESGDTQGVILDSNKQILKDASDDGQANVDFSIKMELTADESYYLGVDYYLDIEEGKIT